MPAHTILDAAGSSNQSERPKPPLAVIVGPTASGKSGLALELAEIRSIEIVNADSRAFYRGMDIGTAKPSPAEQARVPHHLIDILDPDEPMSVAIFQQLALETIHAIVGRHRLPLLVGGTPQYVNALVEGWQVPQVAPNEPRRRERERHAEQFGIAQLHEELRRVDPDAAARTGSNPRRIIRALEVWEATGIPFSQQRTRGDVPFHPIEFELWLPRDVLYARIDERVDRMIANGLVDEVRALLDRGYSPGLPAFSSIGYRQLIPAIAEGANLADAIDRIKTDTHRLVRHQQTWFRRNSRLIRIDMTAEAPLSAVLEHLGDLGKER